jgi:hypothetical protein
MHRLNSKGLEKGLAMKTHQVLKTSVLDPSIILERENQRERRRERQPQEPHISSKKRRAGSNWPAAAARHKNKRE